MARESGLAPELAGRMAPPVCTSDPCRPCMRGSMLQRNLCFTLTYHLHAGFTSILDVKPCLTWPLDADWLLQVDPPPAMMYHPQAGLIPQAPDPVQVPGQLQPGMQQQHNGHAQHNIVPQQDFTAGSQLPAAMHQSSIGMPQSSTLLLPSSLAGPDLQPSQAGPAPAEHVGSQPMQPSSMTGSMPMQSQPALKAEAPQHAAVPVSSSPAASPFSGNGPAANGSMPMHIEAPVSPVPIDQSLSEPSIPDTALAQQTFAGSTAGPLTQLTSAASPGTHQRMGAFPGSGQGGVLGVDGQLDSRPLDELMTPAG